MTSTTTNATEPVKVILRNQLDMEPLEKATNAEQLCNAVERLIEKMLERNHGFYFIELSKLKDIVDDFYQYKHFGDVSSAAITTVFTKLQETHSKLPVDMDVQPGTRWEYIIKDMGQKRNCLS